ncbi:MAG: hypothetical protein JST22_04875 [Bacteroidetes bacterium]|nr:hypothetical protein [Bacteroidota bacterium]
MTLRNPVRYAFLLVLLLAACASSSGTTGAAGTSAARTSATGQAADSTAFRLDRVSLATINTEGMVQFYQRVFEMRFKKLPIEGAYIYTGRIFGVDFVFIPNEVAKVRADRNRHEFNVVVPDIDVAVKRVVNTGGTLLKGPSNGDTERSATVTDPDGNSLVLVQKL